MTGAQGCEMRRRGWKIGEAKKKGKSVKARRASREGKNGEDKVERGRGRAVKRRRD